MSSEATGGRWRTVSVRDVAAINPETTRGLADDHPIRYIDISSVDSSYRITDDIPEIPLAEAPSRAKRLVREGDILFSTVRSERRSFAVVPSRYDQQVASTGFAVIRPSTDAVDPAYLWAAVRTPTFVAHIVSRQRGSNYPAVNSSDVAEASLPLPPIDEQRRIGWVIGSLDEKIENNRSLAATLEEIAAALFKARFVDFVGHDDLIESEIGLIPSGWDVKTIGDVAVTRRKSIDPRNAPDQILEHFSFPAFDSERAPEVTTGASLRSAKLLVDEQCVLVSKLNPQHSRVWWPIPEGHGVPICSPEFVALEPKTGVPHAFLYAAARFHPGVRDHIVAHATGTTGSRQRVRPTEVLAASLAVPSLNALEPLAAPLGTLFAAAERLLRQSRTCEGIRDQLLPKLVSGQIQVPADVEAASEVT